ncbi:MAG: amidohydrolase [Acidobacteriota bacterium]|nr:amidohydrolase [Acidobacteriota bacterium]
MKPPNYRSSRRAFLAALASASVRANAAPVRPPGLIIDTHIHLFASGSDKFPFAQNAPYQPEPAPLEAYLQFIRESKIDHVILVHPEPYQEDHSYLEYCFRHESPKGLFKGTCLFDPLSPETPARMEALVSRNPGRIVALRIHEVGEPGSPPSHSGSITNRDMRDPAMDRTWNKAHELGLAIQMHFLPYYAQQIGELARKHEQTPVILDHVARAGLGTPGQFEQVLALAKLPHAYMKISGINYSSREKAPFRDVRPFVMRAYQAFGPDRLLWGDLGHTVGEFETAVRIFDTMFEGVPEPDKAKIRGLNAKRLFRF